MAKPNYSSAKRQREIAKQKKKAEKRAKKLGLSATDESMREDQPPATGEGTPAT
jgi:hypothetical protein